MTFIYFLNERERGAWQNKFIPSRLNLKRSLIKMLNQITRYKTVNNLHTV